ncbi:MAG: hypothetical protein ACK559_20515 [bacterium]
MDSVAHASTFAIAVVENRPPAVVAVAGKSCAPPEAVPTEIVEVELPPGTTI